jgi:SAM-dependent methyltransferase
MLKKYRSPIIFDNTCLRENSKNTQKHFDESKKELEKFPTIGGVIVDQKYVDMVPCPICQNRETNQYIVKWGGRYDVCEKCSHIFLKNRLKVSILNNLYKYSIADQLSRAIKLNKFSQDYWSSVYSKYIEIIKELLPVNNNISLLDIGCGAGTFCKEASFQGLDVYANDIYDEVVETLSPIVGSDNVERSSIEDINSKRKYNVVTLWGAVEHIPNGHSVFETARRVCTKNGLLVILIPNLKSRAFRLLGVHTPALNPRQHINFYTDKSIGILAKKYNFSLLGKPFPELPIIDLMWDFIDKSDKNIVQDIIDKGESYYKVYIFKSND